MSAKVSTQSRRRRTPHVSGDKDPFKLTGSHIEYRASAVPSEQLGDGAGANAYLSDAGESAQASALSAIVENAYSRPEAFLPSDSKAPPRRASSARLVRDVTSPVQAALGNVQNEAAKINQALRRYVINRGELDQSLTQLGQAIDHACNLLHRELKDFTRTKDDETSAATVRAASDEHAQEELRGYVIYDKYFNVTRVASMSGKQFVAQVVATCQCLLRDLPFTFLEIERLLTLTETVQTMFEFLTQNYRSDEKTRHSKKDGLALLKETTYRKSWSEIWNCSADEIDDWTNKVAVYRWCVGHHFFNLCAILGREHLEQAESALRDAEEERGAELILTARKFLRGAGAAMCYAANFPSEVYQNLIRPSMIMTETPYGFSGSQNADHNHFKAAKKGLMQTVFACYGKEHNEWPSAVYSAVKAFHDSEIEDSELHILIAVSKVGTDSSLAQKIWQGRLPSGVRVKNAVDVLRDMAEMKRRQYQF